MTVHVDEGCRVTDGPTDHVGCRIVGWSVGHSRRVGRANIGGISKSQIKELIVNFVFVKYTAECAGGLKAVL